MASNSAPVITTLVTCAAAATNVRDELSLVDGKPSVHKVISTPGGGPLDAPSRRLEITATQKDWGFEVRAGCRTAWLFLMVVGVMWLASPGVMSSWHAHQPLLVLQARHQEAFNSQQHAEVTQEFAGARRLNITIDENNGVMVRERRHLACILIPLRHTSTEYHTCQMPMQQIHKAYVSGVRSTRPRRTTGFKRWGRASGTSSATGRWCLVSGSWQGPSPSGASPTS